MKTLILALTLLISHTAFADTFSDREHALQAENNQNTLRMMAKSDANYNRKFLHYLAAFAAQHHGAKGIINCQSAGATFDYEHKENTGTTTYRAAGILVRVTFTARDLKGLVLISDSLTQLSYDRAPMPETCTFELRDGLACETIQEDAHLPDDQRGYDLYAECISASLKKSRVKLGPLFE